MDTPQILRRQTDCPEASAVVLWCPVVSSAIGTRWRNQLEKSIDRKFSCEANDPPSSLRTSDSVDERTNSGWRRDDVVHPGRWPTRCLSLWRWAVFRIGEGEQRPTSIKYSRPEHCPAPRRQPGKEGAGDETAHHQPDRDALLLGNRCGGGREGHKRAGYPRALRRGQPASGSNVRTCRRWGVPVVPMSGYQVR